MIKMSCQMKFHLTNRRELIMVKRSLFLLTILVLASTIKVFSQNIPDKPSPSRAVNDFAGMLDAGDVNSLERKLDAFYDSTSTQIVIVTVPSLDGYDKADYAQQLGEKWGVGQKGKNNGILILVKPKTSDSSGEVQIATGYGVEGPIPDLTCSDIVNREILPAFRNGDYYGGLDKATSVLMSLARGEFPASEYAQRGSKKAGSHLPLGLILFIVFIIILISGRSGGSNNRHISSKGLPFWLLMSMMGSGRGSGGSWGGFSGGSGGGGGGFSGGFGGGSFGGGGAGGSW
jgi:uncharacterized protein